MFIVVEGGIGAGKTSLTNLISDNFNYKKAFEIVEENPYLEKFYSDPDRWAFLTEMFFLTHRYNQVSNLKKLYIDQNKSVVADYNIMKNLIFAQNNLSAEEFKKFNQIFNLLNADLPEPNLYIFIKAPLKVLQERIARRGRDFEQDINQDYLQYLIQSYDKYVNDLVAQGKNVLVINADEIDFVNNLEDHQYIKEIIQEKILMHNSKDLNV